MKVRRAAFYKSQVRKVNTVVIFFNTEIVKFEIIKSNFQDFYLIWCFVWRVQVAVMPSGQFIYPFDLTSEQKVLFPYIHQLFDDKPKIKQWKRFTESE